MRLNGHSKEGLGHHSRCHTRQPWRWFLVSILFPVTVAAMADAEDIQMESPIAIKAAARAFVVQQIEQAFPVHTIEVKKLDSRLKLAACDVPLEGFLPPGGRLPGTTTVGVRCSGAKPWTIYIPAIVKVIRQVVVTKHPVLRGTPIGKTDVTLEEREISGNIDAYIFDTSNVLGKIAKRPMSAATALTTDMLDAPLLVRRGQQIIILAEDSGIEVRMPGTALMDGTEGQWVRVQSAHSKRTVEGLVIEPGIIKVNM